MVVIFVEFVTRGEFEDHVITLQKDEDEVGNIITTRE